WQDKAVKQMIASIEANNMWGYARLGFFSHDSFKIQKGLLWSQRDNKYVGYIDFDDKNAELEAFSEQCLHDIQIHVNDHKQTENEDKKDPYFAIETIDVHTLNTILFHLAAKLECVAIHTCGSVCDGVSENRRHIKNFDWFATTWKMDDKVEVQLSNRSGKKSYQPATIISFNPEHTKFLVQLSGTIIQSCYNVMHSVLRSPMPAKTNWNINDQCEVRNTVNNKWYPGKVLTEISVDGYLDVEVAIKTVGEVQLIVWKLLLSDIHSAYNENQHWTWHLTINPKLRNNVSKSHTSNGEGKNIREIMFDGWEISWKHFRGVYDHTEKHMTAKATKLTKRHIWLTSWSKMRVDLAEHTLSLEVKKAMEDIPELKYISQGTQLFIHYTRIYRDITHSQICISSLEDPRLNTLKEIKKWFIQAQCQFDLISSINGFLGIVEYVLNNCLGAIIQPKRISQDMLEGLFGMIREMGDDSSTQTIQSYGYAMNKLTITMQMTSEI
ncbi:1049_t:CDS:2, partial [Acaulospora morrowiae]